MTIIEDAEKYLNEKPSPFMTKDRRLKRSAVLIEGLVKEIERRDMVIGKLDELLNAADCPQCRDKSGAHYDNQGEVCQCQWCYEKDEVLSQLEDNE